MSARAPLAGLALVLLPLALVAMLARPSVGRHAQGSARAEPAAQAAWSGWGAPESDSLRLLRRVSAAGAGRAANAVPRCERSAAAYARPAAAYRRCALAPLAAAASSARSASALLRRLTSEARPPEPCRRLIDGLAERVSSLGQAGGATLNDWHGLAWSELRDAGRAVVALGNDVRAATRGQAWRSCLPR
jgi:hypothetical protein